MKLRFPGTAYRPYDHKKNDLFTASLLIDGRVLVDPTEDLFDFRSLFAMEDLLDGVDTVLITHSHPSHLSPTTIERLAAVRPITVFAGECVLDLLPEGEHIRRIPLLPLRTARSDAYTITALPAVHTTAVPAEVCYALRIERDGHALLYAVDGAGLSERTEEHLRRYPVQAMILDAAYGDTGEGRQHMRVEEAVALTARARAEGLLTGRAYSLLVHVPTHADPDARTRLGRIAADGGCLLPYDGYFLDV